MYVTVHRGTQQIGGNLIEIGTEQTRLLFDAGANLPPLDGPKVEDPFELDGLTQGKPAFDWVFLSHHHNDHCGLLGKLLPGIPVFAGDETKRILNVIADFTNQPRPEINFGFRDGHPIQLDDIRVTPIGVEHSAKDAYMFLVQADGKNVLYTGDFRASEKALSAVRELLGEGEKLDLLITEGTNIRPGKPERAGEFQGRSGSSAGPSGGCVCIRGQCSFSAPPPTRTGFRPSPRQRFGLDAPSARTCFSLRSETARTRASSGL